MKATKGNPAPTPERIRWIVGWLKNNPRDWKMVEELAHLHETLNWFPESAPWIRLRRPRAALIDALLHKASLSYLAAGTYFYDNKLWEPKAWDEYPEMQEQLEQLYEGYNVMVQEGCHNILAITALKKDRPEYWPICPMYGGTNIVKTLLGDFPGWGKRLGELSPLFDRQLADKAKLLIESTWILPFESPNEDIQNISDLINQSTHGEMPTDGEILDALRKKGAKVTFTPRETHSPQPKER
jgi:hypothetical protein